MNWQLQEAKNKLSQVVEQALTQGPQVITVRGKETAVLMSTEEFHRLTARDGSFLEFMQASPWVGIELDLERSEDTGRAVDL